jgi:3-phosphoshikimate 1-carboxyvinyltransferase
MSFADVLAQRGAWCADPLDRGQRGATTRRHHRLRRDSRRSDDAGDDGAVRRRPTTLTNIGSWRVRNRPHRGHGDRVGQLGVTVTSGDDWLRVVPPKSKPLRSAVIDTYDDHRMAMCFSLATLRVCR